MVQENVGDEVKPVKSPNEEGSLYESLSTVATERVLNLDVEGEEDEFAIHQTLGERIKESPNLSDTQTIVKELFPSSGHSHLDAIQVSRIFPDIYNPFARALVKDLLQKEDELSVVEAMATVNTSMSIGIDGESRIELVALAGAAKDTETALKEKEKLGLA